MRRHTILLLVPAIAAACCAPDRAPPPVAVAPTTSTLAPAPAPAAPSTAVTQPAEQRRRAPESRRTPSTVDLGLLWLADHQNADGSWDGGVGATGLALLAFGGAGETHQSGNFKESVKRGLGWLRAAQDADGCFGPRSAPGSARAHAIAAVAMTEAFGMTSSLPYREPAERGAAFALSLRRPGGGWHRSAAVDGAADAETLDVETTGWMVMLLKSAELAEVRVAKIEIAEAVAEIDRSTDHAAGRIGGPAGRLDTAVGLVARILAGHTPKTDATLRKCADAVFADAPAWDDATELRRIYFANVGMYQFGGARWRRWQDENLQPFGERQRREPGADRGSWDPAGGGAAAASRIESTALGCLMFEVYYRIGDMEGWRRDGEKWNE